MAFSAITTRGSATEKVSDTSISLSPSANLTVGKFVVVHCATDNDSVAIADGTSNNHSLADSQSNTWVKVAEYTDSDGAAGDGVTNSLFYTVVTTQISTTDSITLTTANAVTNKIIACFEATISGSYGVDYLSVGVGQSAISASVTNMPSQEYLLVGAGASEGNDSTKTADADYTERFDLRTGSGTAATEICTHTVTRIATVTSDTCTSSAWTNTNPIFLLVSFYERLAPVLTINVSDTVTVLDAPKQTTQTAVSNVIQIYGGSASSGEFSQQEGGSFTADSTSIYALDVYFSRTGTPADNIIIKLTSTLGGSALGTITVPAPSITTGLRRYYFATPVSVTQGNVYNIEVSRSGTRDTANYMLMGYQAGTNPYSGGELKKKDNNAWIVDSTADMTFRVLYEEAKLLLDINYPVNVSDSISVSENVEMFTNVLSLSVSDTVNVTENLKFNVNSSVNVNDSIIISENTQTNLTLSPSVSDSINVSENNRLVEESNVQTSENITLSEALELTQTSFITISDNITLSENIDTNLTSFINVSESVNISESTSVELITNTPPDLNINVSETVNVTENTSVLIPFLLVNVSDLVNVSESTIASLTTEVNVNDSISLSENIGANLTLSINTSDTVNVSESVGASVTVAIATSENISLTENLLLNEEVKLAVSETITVTENSQVEFLRDLDVNVSEAITVSENVNAFRWLDPFTITVSDSISLSENLLMNPPHMPDPSKKLIVLENGDLAILLVDGSIPHYTKV